MAGDVSKNDIFTDEDMEALAGILKIVFEEPPHLGITRYKESLELRFTLASVPAGLKRGNPDLYKRLFGQKKKVGWTTLLRKAYNQSVSKLNKANRVPVTMAFRKMFVDALCMQLANRQNAGENFESVCERNIRALKGLLGKKSRSCKSRSRNESDTVRFARRHEELLRQIQPLRAFVLTQKHLDENRLREEIEKHPTFIKSDWLQSVTQGTALKHLPKKHGDPETASSTLAGDWVSWQLSVGIIYCEEQKLVLRMTRGPDAIYTYILRGRKILREQSVT